MMLLSSAAFWAVAFVSEPLPTWNFSAPMRAALIWGFAINYGIAQIIWFGLARELPATASAFSIMAVPLVGILTATFIVGEVPVWQDWIAAIFIVGAIATTLLARKPATTS
jgi:drug/metabolite transporter (DMT)-like permease